MNAGTTTVRVSSADNSITASCTVHVVIEDGVYYIKNASSGKYLENTGGNVIVFAQDTGANTKFNQLWKITYVGNGRYAIRPMDDTSEALTIGTSSYIAVADATLSNAALPSSYLWTIGHDSNGFYFQQDGASNKTITTQVNGTTTIIYPGTYSTSTACHWTLEGVKGIFLRDTETNEIITPQTVKYIELGDSLSYSELEIGYEYYGSIIGGVTWSSSNESVAGVGNYTGEVTGNALGDTQITVRATLNGVEYSHYYPLVVTEAYSSDPFYKDNIEYTRYTRITGTNWWGLGSETDHTVSILKSSLLSDDYCIVLDNINDGYYRCIYIDDELKTTLNSLEAGYQSHYSPIPAFDTATTQEKAAHAAKEETDQMVEAGYFQTNSSEYYGAWAFNYTSELNLWDYWKGVVDTASKAYGVYMAATSFYYSWLASTNTVSTNVTSVQYNTTASYLDDLDDALGTYGYTNKSIISAEARNESLGLSNPPYKPGTPVVGFETTQATQFVRVYTHGITNQTGKWIMRYSDIQGLTAAQIQDKFALPYTPTHYCFVNVPSGVQMYAGTVNEVIGWGAGEGLQFELAQTIAQSCFESGIPLP